MRKIPTKYYPMNGRTTVAVLRSELIKVSVVMSHEFAQHRIRHELLKVFLSLALVGKKRRHTLALILPKMIVDLYEHGGALKSILFANKKLVTLVSFISRPINVKTQGAQLIK